MADIDVSNLDNIFRMVTPSGLLGAQKLAVGKKIDIKLIQTLLDIIYGINGARDVESISQALTSFQEKTNSELDSAVVDEYRRVINFYKTGEPCKAFGTAPFIAMDTDGKTVLDNVTFDQIVGPNVKLHEVRPTKAMGIMLCNSAFLSPAVRNAERVELFMNFIPSIIASRLVPLLEVEFAFNRGVPDSSVSQPHMWAPGLMKFLLGSDQSTVSDPSSPNAKMLALRETVDEKNTKLQSIAGMEMFTSPQTLINPAPVAAGGRYVDVIDPFRPFMTIESFNVNVRPTVGLYSFKTAVLVFKLHDRSRLSEIADLVRPQVYQDKGSAPTLWVTYGWRHPAEPGNPYADFINGNMLVREAYAVQNSQFAFDNVGQVTITVNLYTKGVPEMRTLNVSDSESLDVIQKIEKIATEVARYRIALGIGSVEGANKEIRGFLLLDSAERGSLPDLSSEEIKKSLDGLTTSLRAPGAKLDKGAVDGLLVELNKLYNPKDNNYLNFKQQLENNATDVTNKRFNEVMIGVDPFLPSDARNTKSANESKKEVHPLTPLVSVLNEYRSESDVKKQTSATTKVTRGFRKKAASFGKLVSVFTANTFKRLESVDEMQLYFYPLNDQAGSAAGINIAEFPIDMSVFLDQYRDHVERKGSERITLEEFLQLAIDAQLHDTRAIAYGFRKYYAPYDPAKKQDLTLAEGIDPSAVEIAKRQFKMPVIGFYIETLHATPGSIANDLLKQFEATTTQLRAEHYARIMRIHIFDKNNNPFKLADTILQADDKSVFVEADSSWLRQQVQDSKSVANDVWNSILNGVLVDGKIDRSKAVNGTPSNSEIKQFVSKMVPTLVYGTNASAITTANLQSKQDALLATTQMQALARNSGKHSTLQSNGSDVGGLPLRIVPASLTLTSLGCPLLLYGQMYFIDFNTGTTVDNIYGLTGLTHSIVPGKFESSLTLTFADAYGKFFGAPTIIDYVKSMQVPEPKK
jgi:hypothetical protein